MKSTNTHPNIPIIFEDNHLLIIDKPEGLLSQADKSNSKDVTVLCKQYLKNAYQKPGNVYLGLTHRLDRPVSGLMILTKTSKAASRISEQIRNHNIKKTYWAIVYGRTPLEAEYKHFLKKDSRTNTTKAFSSKKSGAKEAILRIKTLKQSAHYSLVEVDLITGKPHQIRVQMNKMGFPIWGDYKYGEEHTGPGKKLALRAMALEFIHPVKKEPQIIHASIPKHQPWNLFDY
jgi:23S rRNA pseudouridine1911/1915/1917 synthase